MFLGRFTPEAVGDYVGGPNHVLPTGRRARFASGLSVLDFMKRTSYLACDAASIGRIGSAAVALAAAEGLPAHGRSVALRLQSELQPFELNEVEAPSFLPGRSDPRRARDEPRV